MENIIIYLILSFDFGVKYEMFSWDSYKTEGEQRMNEWTVLVKVTFKSNALQYCITP